MRASLLVLAIALVGLVSADTATFSGAGSGAVFPTVVIGDITQLLSVEFNTLGPNGLLFYQGGLNNQDFFGLELSGGNVVFGFNTGGSGAPTQIASATGGLNDGNWHKVDVALHYRTASLTVDGVLVGTVTSARPTLSVNTTGMFYAGGVATAPQPNSVANTMYVGCLRRLFVAPSMNQLFFSAASGVFTLGGCGDAPAPMSSTIASFVPGTWAAYPTLALWSFPSGMTTFFAFSFRLDAPSGMLFYQGSELNKDFIAAEVVAGVLSVRTNCGSGVGAITLGSGLADGKWHYVQINILSRTTTVTLDHSATASSVTIGSLMAIDPFGPVFFGGLPSGFVPALNSVTTNSLSGCIRDFDTDVRGSLLDFGANLYSGSPNTLDCVNNKVAHFGVDSYIALAPPVVDDAVHTNQISFQMRTTAYTGFVLYQAGTVIDYVSIQIVNGALTAQYNPGSGAATIVSSVRVDDNAWHWVSLTWLQKQGTLTVDGMAVSGTTTGPTISVNTTFTSPLYVGGLPDGFATTPSIAVRHNPDLCIKDLTVLPLAHTRDFVYDAVESHNVDLACVFVPGAPQPSAWFGTQSFAQIPNIDPPNIGGHFEFEFRSLKPNGLLFYQPGISNDHIAVQLIAGAVQLSWNCGSGKKVLSVGSNLGDTKWHSVSVTWFARDAMLTVDGSSASGTTPGSLISVNTTGDATIGGASDMFTIQANAAISERHFEGCIRNFRNTNDVYHLNVDFFALVQASKASLRGYQCGTAHAARFDFASFATFPTFTPLDGQPSSINLQFATTDPNGLLFYQGGLNNVDFASLEVVGGFVVFKFNPGSGRAVITDTVRVDDNMQHSVVATFNGQNGWLSVDNRSPIAGMSVGPLLAVNTTGPLYVGGLAGASSVPNSLDVMQYSGCISFLSFPNMVGILDFVVDTVSHDLVALQCAPATFSIDNAGSAGQSRVILAPISVSDGWNVFHVDFKATTGGLLFFQEGLATDFVSLEVTPTGDVLFKWNPGSGFGMASVTGPFVDGKWHTVKAQWLQKAGSVSVDRSAMSSGTSLGPTISVNATGNLYLGQHVSGAPAGFNGCIGNVVFNGDLYTNQASTLDHATFGCGGAPAPMYLAALGMFGASGSTGSAVFVVVAVAGVALLAIGVVAIKLRKSRSAAAERV